MEPARRAMLLAGAAGVGIDGASLDLANLLGTRLMASTKKVQVFFDLEMTARTGETATVRPAAVPDFERVERAIAAFEALDRTEARP